jgi:hypothetical protein
MDLTARICCVLLAAPCLFCGQIASAQPPMIHDGQHDFDFETGTWKAHVKKLIHPLSTDRIYDGSRLPAQ